MTNPLTERARDIAETVLYPAALDVDRTGVIPATHWHAIAEAG